ncbi:TetR family transcriptional regulator [Kitasatospora herbaricolor]|uniref:TetR/AcrR family transcriptional regulator n=1 Tax=Kitasatospora herbaricolor TaxID=68217 RepID=UPI00174CAAC7|nr:TetR family transcriptional regulator [Kitasatospora herbaricolor]MDQ0312165.1 TetR/AcrR family transcriptional repressor of nem operon [Kitasatospora herbaricolor]GGV49182.1 TetR family transcriptional regulator [Kitasatospora herbaricolor]
MGRVSQAQAQENRARVVATASRLFREQGTGVSVADLMQAAGLTQGGFYKQFASKEALVEEAAAHAFTELAALRTEELREHDGRPRAARQGLIDQYLSPRHRDDAGSGCPAAALAADMARDPGQAARDTYTEGVREFAGWLADDPEDGLARLATLVGGLLLARATEGSELSDEILRAAHAALSDSG